MTDEYRAYFPLASFYLHQYVSHGKGEYVSGDCHTNTIEGFFSLFKRSIYGIYHWVSDKHIHRYLAAQSFRYNLRQEKNGVAFNKLLTQCEGHLSYKELIQ